MELERQIKLTKSTKSKDTPIESPQSAIVIPPKTKLISENSAIIRRIKEAEERAKREKLSDDELIEQEFMDEANAIRAGAMRDEMLKDEMPNDAVLQYIHDAQIPQTRNLADLDENNLMDFGDLREERNPLEDLPNAPHILGDSRAELPVASEGADTLERTPLPKNDFTPKAPKRVEREKIDLSDLLPDASKAHGVGDSQSAENNAPKMQGAGNSQSASGEMRENKMSGANATHGAGGEMRGQNEMRGLHSAKNDSLHILARGVSDSSDLGRDSTLQNHQNSRIDSMPQMRDFTRDMAESNMIKSLDSTQNTAFNTAFDSELDSTQTPYFENDLPPVFPSFTEQTNSATNATPHIISDIARQKDSDAIVGIYTPQARDFESGEHSVRIVDKIDSYDIEFPKIKALYDDILNEDFATDDIDELNEINNSLVRAQKRLEEKLKIAKIRQKLGDIKSVTPIRSNSTGDLENYLSQDSPSANYGNASHQAHKNSADFMRDSTQDFAQDSTPQVRVIEKDLMQNFSDFRRVSAESNTVESAQNSYDSTTTQTRDLTEVTPIQRQDSAQISQMESAQNIAIPRVNTPNAPLTRNEALELQENIDLVESAKTQDSTKDLAQNAQVSSELAEVAKSNFHESLQMRYESPTNESQDEYNENFFDLPPREIQGEISHTNQSAIRSDSQAIPSATIAPNPSDSSAFQLPPLDLLNPPLSQKIDIDDSEIDIKVQNLFNKLRVFKIEGDIVRTYSGPVVTTFEFRPAPNVKVSRIQNLQDDLSMALKATSIRIQAPIPGKDVVGIEIPNNKIQTIYLREVFESDEFRGANAHLPIALGKDVIGNPVIEDLAKLPHLLIAGTTGSGKSVGINAMILSLLYKHTPKELRFIMIDPKFLEFGLYKDIPHLLTPIITDPKKAIIALSKAVEEMNRRYELMDKAKVKTIVGFNEIATQEEKLPYIVIIIDEFADLMIMGGREAEQFLISLAGKARASGIHLIIATQRPTVNVVTGLIKGNLPSKISYRVGSKIDSKVILDETGAEALLGRGDMLFSKTNNIVRLHAPYNDEREIERIVEFLKHQQEVQYDEFFSLEAKEPSATPQPTQISSEGDYKERAKEIIIQSGKTSISYLQRGLGVGFNKAASIIESLEKDGFLSPPNSKGVREIIGN